MLRNLAQGARGIEILVRDHSGADADGARVGVYQAEQVADRFHLLLNVSNALDELPPLSKNQSEARAESP